LAVANYHDHYGTLPPAYIADAQGRPMHSWRVLLLPFLEQRELYEAYHFSEPWDGPNNRKLLAHRPRTYGFHDRRSEGSTVTNYLAVVGDETVWPHDRAVSMSQITDGAGQTILVVENHGADVPWTEPRDLDLATMELDLRARSPNGVSSRFAPPAVASAAGYVHTLALDLPPETLRALLTASGGEQVELDEYWKQVADARDRPEEAP
jgi:hypothetical protein